jgi:2-amino-4-hydroxy-6-hydroxymethyldihydropteridine diphosphokinase/dihydropteroate synthase
MGRPKGHEKWSPRTVDLDLLLYHDCVIDNPRLTVPHGEILRRPFLLHLLATMRPELPYPGLEGETLSSLAATHLPARRHFTASFVVEPKFVGILNVTPDSFSDGGRHFSAERAVEWTCQLARDGATLVDIGAQSTRPGATPIAHEEEWARLQPVLETLHADTSSDKVPLSLDCFVDETILKALKSYKIAWINDQSGRLREDTLRAVAERGLRLCVVHSLSLPSRDDAVIDRHADPLKIILEWGKRTVNRLRSLGFEDRQIVLDPGIGFGKNCYQNLDLLRRAEHLRSLGIDVLVGHSRKSYVGAFGTAAPGDRDVETLAVSHYLRNIPYLRIHDVAQHQRFFVAHDAVGSPVT